MKKSIAALAVIGSALVLAAGVGASSDGGTLIDSGFACNILDGNGNVFVTTASEEWLYEHRVVLRCGGYGAPYTGPNPPHYFTFAETGLLCNIGGYGTTEDWVDKVGRGTAKPGQVVYNSQLTCTLELGPSSTSASANGLG